MRQSDFPQAFRDRLKFLCAGMKRGTVVGGPMAGLAGGVETFNLPATDINLRLPAYGLAHVDGTPREHWVPKERVQPDEGGPDDPALARALEKLR
jgi:carboxyl-terminal processing protease